jgi:hypothetical protein
MTAGTPGDGDGLICVTSLQEFFRDSLDDSAAANNISLDQHTSHYVVNLLTLFARSEEFYEPTDDGLRLRPLASMLADSLEAKSATESNNLLQRIGDVALFVSGFLADSLHRAPVDVDYYVHMGGNAYRSLSAQPLDTVHGRAFATVYADLADNFQALRTLAQNWQPACVALVAGSWYRAAGSLINPAVSLSIAAGCYCTIYRLFWTMSTT